MTRYAMSESWPWSKTFTTLGCASRAAERASWMKRSRNALSSARCPCITFTATRRSSRRSVAT